MAILLMFPWGFLVFNLFSWFPAFWLTFPIFLLYKKWQLSVYSQQKSTEKFKNSNTDFVVIAQSKINTFTKWPISAPKNERLLKKQVTATRSSSKLKKKNLDTRVRLLQFSISIFQKSRPIFYFPFSFYWRFFKKMENFEINDCFFLNFRDFFFEFMIFTTKKT